MTDLLLVVEGDGEKTAGPALIRNLLASRGVYGIRLETHRRHGLDHLKANHWSNFKRYLQAAYNEECPILWTFDVDDDCAVDVVKEAVEITLTEGVRFPIAFAFWSREWETMFLYDFETSKKVLGIPDEVVAPTDPESIRGAKGWITRAIPGSDIYKETIHQEKLSAQVDVNYLSEAYWCFAHFDRCIEWLLNRPDPDMYPFSFLDG